MDRGIYIIIIIILILSNSLLTVLSGVLKSVLTATTLFKYLFTNIVIYCKRAILTAFILLYAAKAHKQPPTVNRVLFPKLYLLPLNTPNPCNFRYLFLFK